MRPRLLTLVLVALVAACGSTSAAVPRPSPSAFRSPSASPSPLAQLGPGGLTLDQEIGAVMMVGFQGPLTGAVVNDWQSRQFGGLLLINGNHNASSASLMSALIASVRNASPNRVIAATDQEGGYVCLALSTVPCVRMPVGQADTTRMAAALNQIGFDLDLGPVSDVCSGSSSIM